MLSLAAADELVARAHGMDVVQAQEFLTLLLSGTLAVNDGARLLVRLAERGETATELAALVRALHATCVQIPAAGPCLDLCGTGGSGRTRFNVSTTAAFVLAAAGVPVAKHGNRGSARPNGSFDLLDALSIPFQLPPAALAQLRAETGVCFLFARAMHPAVAAVAPYRKAAERRTIFNLAGPLANPYRPTRQLVGVANRAVAAVLADALQMLGVERALVVWGEPGIDEVSISGATHWLDVTPAAVISGTWTPAQMIPYERIPAGDAAENAGEFQRLLTGTGDSAAAQMVAVNAAAAMDLWHGRPVLADPATIAQAHALLIGGPALAAFTRHRALAQRLGGVRP